MAALPQEDRSIIRMENHQSFFYTRRRALCAALAVSCLVLCARHFHAYGQDKSDFPDGYDAVQAAPKSHRVIFENAFVRVLEVTVSPGTTVPIVVRPIGIRCLQNFHGVHGFGFHPLHTPCAGMNRLIRARNVPHAPILTTVVNMW